MLDITLLRRDLAGVIARLEQRKKPQPFLDVDRFSALEAERKRIQTRTEELQARRNALSKQIGQAKGKGEDASALMAEVGGIADELKAGAERLDVLQAELQGLLRSIPNLPHDSVPDGADADGNSVGAHVAGLASIAAYRRFASQMQQANEQAVAKALARYAQPTKLDQIWPFEIITIGGDGPISKDIDVLRHDFVESK